MNKIAQAPYMETLFSCLEYLRKEGFTTDFKVNGLTISPLNSVQGYESRQIKVVSFYRFEGQSNPDDNSILYAIETDDGMKGTLIDAYGVYADSEIGNFMLTIENFHKKGVSEL